MAELDWFSNVIAGICRGYDSPTYIEIGIGAPATTVNLVAAFSPSAKIYGVDTAPYSNYMPQNSVFFEGESDKFFEQHLDLKADVIFIDGDHRAEQVERDVENSLIAIKEHGVVIMHDTWPTDRCQLDGTGIGGYLGTAYLIADKYNAITLPIYPGLSFLTKWKARPFVLG